MALLVHGSHQASAFVFGVILKLLILLVLLDSLLLHLVLLSILLLILNLRLLGRTRQSLAQAFICPRVRGFTELCLSPAFLPEFANLAFLLLACCSTLRQTLHHPASYCATPLFAHVGR